MQSAELNDSPTAWFAILERAVRTNDKQLFDEAERNLRALGVTVTITWPTFSRRKQGGRDAK